MSYTTRNGTKIVKWPCGSTNKAAGHRVCDCPCIYEEVWNENLGSDDPLLKYKTRLLMKLAAAGPIQKFDSELMRMVRDIITVHEDGRLQIRLYDGTEFELQAE